MIQLNISQEVEQQLVIAARARGLEPNIYANQVFADAVAAGFYTSEKHPTPEEFRAALDRMAELGKDAPTLSEYALTRESFYEDHN